MEQWEGDRPVHALSSGAMSSSAVVWDPALLAYNLGNDHPFNPVRLDLTIRLATALGVLDDVPFLVPEPAEAEELYRAHSAEYVEAVKQAPMAGWDVGHGLGTPDNPVFTDMHEASSLVVGSTLLGARRIAEGRARRAVNIAGGLHHAMRARASGFCVYNDCAVAIQALLDAGVERVAYIDIDVHHGDGTQWIFYEDPRVLTCSVHESGRYLFPGTGGIVERGVGNAEGTAVNIPLPPFAGDRPYLRAIEEVIAPAVLRFSPQVIVTQDGADPHHADPLAHLQVTMAAFPRVYRALHLLADEAAGGRWVALGGGGYTFSVVPRAWTMLFAQMVGADLDDELPEAWRRAGEELVGEALPRRMSDDPEPEAPLDERMRADVEGDRAVDEAKLLLGV